MKHYQIKVKNSKSVFFEELLRCFDFIEFEKIDGFSGVRQDRAKKVELSEPISGHGQKSSIKSTALVEKISGQPLDSLKAAMLQIEKLRKGKYVF